MNVKFNKQYISGREVMYVNEVIKSGQTSGDKSFTAKATRLLEELLFANKILLTTTGSAALELACRLAEVKGYEVILPSFTFPSTANAVILNGGRCVFAEIDESMNLDLDDVVDKITARTKAIIVVHYAGSSCDMDRLMQIAEENNLVVIEDAAQAINAMYKDKYLGTIGDFGCLSFHQTKNVSSGEGGALLINKAEDNAFEKAEIFREKGTNRSSFVRGDVEIYDWVDWGSSLVLSEILAAHLLAQLEDLDKITSLREEKFLYYLEKMNLFGESNFEVMTIPDYNKSNYHIMYIKVECLEIRDELIKYMKSKGVQAFFHYIPLHNSPYGKVLDPNAELPITEILSNKLLRLPLYPDLETNEIDYIIETIANFYSER